MKILHKYCFLGFFFFLENILVILWNKDHGKIEKENWRAGMIIKNDIFILLHS